jgi:hypothetical protein
MACATPEGAHARASCNMHTGYLEGQGGIVYPSIGAIVSKELGSEDAAMPNFVSIGQSRYGSGFLGARHQPLIVNDARTRNEPRSDPIRRAVAIQPACRGRDGKRGRSSFFEARTPTTSKRELQP